MILDLVRVKEKRAPDVGDPGKIEHARIWNCSFESLAWIGNLTQIRTLVIAKLPDADLDLVMGLSRLEYLSVLHLPHVRRLDALSSLSTLRVLRLATLPSWDSSGKVTEVERLAPLGELPKLKYLEMFGVRTPSKSLAELELSSSLESVRVSKYPRSEVDRFRKQTGWNDKFAPSPPVEGWT